MADAKMPEVHFTLSLEPCDDEGVLAADRPPSRSRFGLTVYPKTQTFDPRTGKMEVELGRRWDDGIETGDLEFVVPDPGGYYRFILRNDAGQVVEMAGNPTWYAAGGGLQHPLRVSIPRQD